MKAWTVKTPADGIEIYLAESLSDAAQAHKQRVAEFVLEWEREKVDPVTIAGLLGDHEPESINEIGEVINYEAPTT